MILFRWGCEPAVDVVGKATSAKSARTSGAMLRIRLTACVCVGFAGCEAGPAPRWPPPRSAAACGTARPTGARLSRVLRAGRSSRLQRCAHTVGPHLTRVGGYVGSGGLAELGPRLRVGRQHAQARGEGLGIPPR